jgi:hypothetical protein
MSRTLRALTAASALFILASANAWTADEPSSAAADPPSGTQGKQIGSSRWQTPPVCQLVSGLPQSEGEFIAARVSEIARAAKVPLGGDHCQPNLYILVSADPKGLLKGMEERNRQFTFHCGLGQALPGVVNAFISTPRAVRVWYNSTRKTTDGVFLGCTDPTSRKPDLVTHGVPSRIAFNAVSTFWTVFVVVDQTRLQGVTRGQLADYVAMVGLAQVTPEMRPDNAHSILTLFDAKPQAAPPGLTDWDTDFLKSLYATQPELAM